MRDPGASEAGRPGRPTGARDGLWTAALLAGAAVLTFYRLGAGSLWDQDETKYAQVAREILERGDWVTLSVNHVPWYVHPPFYMWLTALTGRVAGFSELTVRFWSGAFSVVAVYATVLIGRDLFGPRVGLLAGAMLAVTFHFLVQSRLAVFDTVLLAWMLLGVHAFLRAYRRGGRADWLRFFLYCGLATLTKGPIGLILPGMVAAAFVTVRGAWHRWREVPWALGLAVYAVIGLSWYGAETWLHGRAFVATVFGYYGVGRFFGVVENQAGPWYYYVPILLIGAFPWTAFWPAAAAFHGRRLRDDGSLFVVLWCVLTFAFYTAAGTKLPNYVLPIYPLAAVGVAAWWEASLPARWLGWEGAISLGFLVVLLGALFWGIGGYLAQLYPARFHALGHLLVAPAVALAAGVALVLVLTVTGARLAALLAMCAAMAATWLSVVTWVVPVVEAEKPMKPLALEIHAALRPGDRIVGYRFDIYSSLIYYTDHHVDWIDDPAALRAAVCAPGRVFVVSHLDDLARVRLPPVVSRFAARGGVVAVVKPAAARCAP
ncbi:MAG TPA: glycosyltransferase family 39 protein [bacterium]|nr:glycosyltransferase family 39 protein [bacterium]